MSWWRNYGSGGDYEDRHTLAGYSTPAEALIVEGPIYADSKRGDIGREWWGQAWVRSLEQLGMQNRLQRGKSYARNGAVLRIEISHGMVYARVQGSQRRPYRTAIELRMLSDAQWEKALARLAEQAIYVAHLLAGEMPGDIETVFQDCGLSLFPQSSRDISFVCSCPDDGDPCKHAAALYYLVAEQLDTDPFIMFHLRGRSRDAVLDALRGTVDEAMPDDAVEGPENPPLTLEGFWEAPAPIPHSEMPRLNTAPVALQQLGKAPAGLDRDLNRVYQVVSREAARWLGLE